LKEAGSVIEMADVVPKQMKQIKQLQKLKAIDKVFHQTGKSLYL
jgi:hypothetical protein